MQRITVNLVTILLFIGWAVLYSMNIAINAPTFHLDGAFQTASGLFRLDAGQVPGMDFYPYLGIGPLLSLYPAFEALGADLAASVSAAQLMTLVSAWLAWSILWQLSVRPRSFATSFVTGALLVACMVVALNSLPPLLRGVVAYASNPGNSLRPIRAVAPYLAAALYYFLLMRCKPFRTRMLLSGAATGAILLWSNDYALPTAGLFALLIAADIYRSDGPKWRSGALYLSSSVLVAAALLGLATLGHPLELLRYNFHDVRVDQWWYFGPYDESSRIFELGQFFRVIWQEAGFPLIVLALAAVVALWTRTIEHLLLAWIGVVLLGGGTLASVGGHLDGYFGPFHHWGVVTAVFGALKAVFFLAGKVRASGGRSSPSLAVSPALVAFAVMFSAALFALQEYRAELDIAEKDPKRFYVSELGGYLGLEWKEYINLARSTKTQNVVEEYWGLWSATRRILPAWPVDSAIHALGRTRGVAAEALPEAELVISTRRSVAPRWQPWGLSQNFWFYDELLQHWTPQELSPMTVVWHKNRKARPRKAIACRLSEDKKSILLNIDKAGFYRVEMDYAFAGKGRHLTLARNNLSYAAGARGYVSFDPDGNKAIFPAYLSQRPTVALDLKVVGSGPYVLQIGACTASEITLVDDEVLAGPKKSFWFS